MPERFSIALTIFGYTPDRKLGVELTMSARMKPADGAMTLAEMKEFASFSAATQRYIRRSLDIGLDREDALSRWSRDVVEAASIRAQARLYDRLPDIRATVPDDSAIEAVEPFLAPLVSVSAFDLGQSRLPAFAAYRFLYERLIGAEVRPWLPAAFCAASAMPQLHPDLRRKLLQSISEAAATASGWSVRQPSFFPSWVEKVDSNALPN
ncbi:hypothetical protein GCM10011329_17600 [Stakelama pacifica]|nr:hypothetical protein GCM10011329_17600 [Stakelama pacifica]